MAHPVCAEHRQRAEARTGNGFAELDRRLVQKDHDRALRHCAALCAKGNFYIGVK